jgi:hypothetical protein
MRRIPSWSIFSRYIICSFIIGSLIFWWQEGLPAAETQLGRFLAYNVAPLVVFFALFFVVELFLAPGRLLWRDIGRELSGEWLDFIVSKIGEGGRLIEEIRLGQDLTEARASFDAWVDSVRQFLRVNLPRYEHIFDDIDVGPFGPLLDLPNRMRAALPANFPAMARPVEDPRETLIDMISRRRSNLERIYEQLAPLSAGEPRHV